MIIDPFYNLLSAGEEKKAKYIGTKMLDAGDIMHTLSGWTAVGHGKSLLPLINLPFSVTRNFRKKSSETHKGIQAMDQAISELSVHCDPKDSASALYLLTAPSKEMNVELVKELGDSLRSIAPEAIIRNGDYPRESGEINVVVILSRLNELEKVKQYYIKASSVVAEIERKQESMADRPNATEEVSKDIPTLL